MAVKSSVNAKFNYTGRKKIPHGSDTISLFVKARRPESLDVVINLNREKILNKAKISEKKPVKFVIDAFYRGDKRIELSPHVNRQEETLEDCPDTVNPTFRLSVVSDEEESRGKLLAATRIFGATESAREGNAGQKRNDFLKINKSLSLGGLLWKIEWTDPTNPVISMNAKLWDKYGDPQHSKEVQAFLYPEIVREIVAGLLTKIDDLDSLEDTTFAYQWRLFCEQRLDMDFDSLSETDNNDIIYEKVDEAVVVFMNMAWRNGKTLLDELVGG